MAKFLSFVGPNINKINNITSNKYLQSAGIVSGLLYSITYLGEWHILQSAKSSYERQISNSKNILANTNCEFEYDLEKQELMSNTERLIQNTDRINTFKKKIIYRMVGTEPIIVYISNALFGYCIIRTFPISLPLYIAHNILSSKDNLSAKDNL